MIALMTTLAFIRVHSGLKYMKPSPDLNALMNHISVHSRSFGVEIHEPIS